MVAVFVWEFLAGGKETNYCFKFGNIFSLFFASGVVFFEFGAVIYCIFEIFIVKNGSRGHLHLPC